MLTYLDYMVAYDPHIKKPIFHNQQKQKGMSNTKEKNKQAQQDAKNYYSNWNSTRTAGNPYGEKRKLNELINFRKKKNMTWSKLGLTEHTKDILYAHEHHNGVPAPKPTIPMAQAGIPPVSRPAKIGGTNKDKPKVRRPHAARR